VYLTKDLVVANVSSKSKTVIPLLGLTVLDILTALLSVLVLLRFGFNLGILYISSKVLPSSPTIVLASILISPLKYRSNQIPSNMLQPLPILVVLPAFFILVLST